MKINRHTQFRASKKKSLLIPISVGSGVVFIFAAVFLFNNFFSEYAERIATPFWMIGNNLSTESSIGGYFRSKKSLIRERNELRDKIEQSAVSMQIYDLVIDENITLRNLLGIQTSDTIVASVIGAPPQAPYDTIILDQGEKSGITKNSLLLAPSGNSSLQVALGAIHTVSPYISRAKLFSTPGIKIETLIGPEKVRVLLRGRGGGTFTADIPKDSDIEEGDIATLLGTDFLVGRVEKRIEDPGEQFTMLYVSAFHKPSTIKYVQISTTIANEEIFATSSPDTL